MAFKPNIYRRKQTPTYLKAIKIGACIIVTVAAIVWGFILYFNGQNAKAPLLKLLSERTNFTINCESIEFSPIYPDILKLKKVSLGKSSIGEIYVEYDLKSVISSEKLNIKYLYAKDISFDNDDLETLKKEKFRYKNITINKLDLINGPFSLGKFKSEHADLNAVNVEITENGDIDFKESVLNTQLASIDGHEIKKLHANMLLTDELIELKDVQMQMYGGTLFADIKVDKLNQHIEFSKLSLNNVIIQNYNEIVDNYSINAKNATITSCVLSLPNANLLLGQITGKIDNLKIKDKKISFEFTGKAGEISRPDLLITADQSLLKAIVTPESVQFHADGKLFDGQYSAKFELTDLDKDSSKLYINNFNLTNAKLEPQIEMYERLKYLLFSHNTVIKNLSVNNTEFVSHINSLPVSIKSVSIKTEDIVCDQKEKKIQGTPGKFDIKIDSGYYRDLFVKAAELNGVLAKDFFSIFLNKIQFYNSVATASIVKDFSKNNLAIKAKADNFDMSDLNSSLFKRLFNGKLSFDIDLNTISSTDKELSLREKLSGSILLKSDSLLVSSFGLDLINGGIKKDYELDKHQLEKALENGDCGFYNLSAKVKVNNGQAKLKLSSDLATSHLTLNGNYDVTDRIIDTRASMISLAKDSLTSVIIRGHVTDPTFYITAIMRGAIRPGIDESSFNPEANTPNHPEHNSLNNQTKPKEISDKPQISDGKKAVSLQRDETNKTTNKELVPDSLVIDDKTKL